MPTASHVTPMLRFLRALNGVEEVEAFAAAVGTTRHYLYQLAAQAEPNPKLKFALAVTAESRRIAKKHGTTPLTLEDLLVGVPPED